MGKYTQDAAKLLELVGGKENIAAVSHCMTRMRFVLNDPALANIEAIEAIPSVKGSFTQAGQFQVIIGNTVADFYNDFTAVSGIEGVSKDQAKSAAKQNQNQGEELGMTNHHYTAIDQYRDVESLNYYRILMETGKTSEEALQILAERSRDNGRTPMQWDDSHAAGFTTGTPWIYPPENYRRINAAAQMNDETSVHAFYKKLVQLRKEMDVISEGKIEFLMKEDEKILAYRRYTDSQEMLVLCNLTGEEAPVTLPADWEKSNILIANWDSAAVCTDLNLRPYECLALTK